MIKGSTIEDLSRWHKVLFKEALELKQAMSEAYDEGNLPLYIDFKRARHELLNDCANTLVKLDHLDKQKRGII